MVNLDNKEKYVCDECALLYEPTEPDFGLCDECTEEQDLDLALTKQGKL